MVAIKNETNDAKVARNSNKRPRASIACFRCHHKKVRCDATQPECSRCKSTGIVCAYPPSRRSRSTQPTHNSPFINDITHLESRIRGIESDLERQKSMVKAILLSSENSPISNTMKNQADGSSMLAQLLGGEGGEHSSTKKVPKNKKKSKMSDKGSSHEKVDTTMMYDIPEMVWNDHRFDENQIFDIPAELYIKDPNEKENMMLLNSMNSSTRSSSLGSQLDFDFTLQPSYSTTSTTSSSSSSTSTFTDSYDQMFDYPMLLQSEQDASFLSNNNGWNYV